MKMTDVIIRCSCGAVQGIAHDVSAKSGNRCVCYCDDCQAFAQFLGRVDEILDTNGGTDIFQMSPAKVEFTSGKEHLASMRLSPNGLLRWYAECCKTPIGNTQISPSLPFVGMIHNCIYLTDSTSRDRVLGPVRAGVNGRFARGDTTGLNLHDKAPPGLLLRLIRLIAKWRLQGAHRNSAFHEPKSGLPSKEPLVLSKEERHALY